MSKTKVEITLETLVEFAASHRKQMKEIGDHFDQSLVNVNSTINELAIQSVQLNAQIKKTNQTVERVAEAVERQNAAIDQTREAIDGHLTVAREQSANIAQLIELAKLQQAAVDRLLAKN